MTDEKDKCIRKVRDSIVCAAEGCEVVIINPAYNQKFCCYRCGRNRTLRGVELNRKYWENRWNILWLRQREGQEIMRIALVPCPFCGKIPEFEYEARDNGSDIAYISCCLGQLVFYEDEERPAAKAVEAWNTRPENGQK